MPEILTRALPLALGQFLLIAALAALASGPGRVLLGSLRFNGRVEELCLSVTSGLALYGLAFLLLGLLGVFGPAAAVLTVAGGWLIALRSVHARPAPTPSLTPRKVDAPTALVAAAWLIFWLLPALVLTLYPPVLYDDIMYHLPFSEALWESGKLSFHPDLRYPVFPQLQEAVWSPLLGLLGPPGPAALVLLETLLTAGLLYSWGLRRHSRHAGLAAAALWLGCPSVVLYGSASYVDSGVALFVVGAFVALDHFRLERSERWLVAAGAFVGAAAATKYVGLFFVLALVTVVAMLARRSRPVLIAAAAAALVAGPVYLWIAAGTGNPLFPFFPDVFGYYDWDRFHAPQGDGGVLEAEPVERGGAAHFPRIPHRIARRAAEIGGEDVLELPLRLTVLPGERWGPPPYNMFLLIALPLAALPGMRWRGRGFGVPTAVAVASGPAWLLTVPDPRYLFPAVALLCVPLGAAVAHALSRWVDESRSWSVWLVACVLLLAIVPGSAYGLFRVSALGPVPRTDESREAFIARWEPGFRALSQLHALRGGSYVLYSSGAPQLQFFARGRMFGHHYGPHRFQRVERLLDDPPALHRQLRTWGADHLLLVEGPRRWPASEALAEGAGFRLLWRDPESLLFALIDEPDAARPESSTGAPGTR